MSVEQSIFKHTNLGECEYTPILGFIKLNNQRIYLTWQEDIIFERLAQNPNKTIPYGILLDDLYEKDDRFNPKRPLVVLSMRISSLRKKLPENLSITNQQHCYVLNI
ncbi:MAG TPA: helix-turn-helix domain-containing protein [Patescibacteria group bacterium]|nr:helix-turn-helix domain-containing protein [Patescibacteria group bacterium]